MPKLPKALSSNARARSTSTAQRSLDWSHRTEMRSGSRIIAAMQDSGPREKKTFAEQVEALKRKIEREQRRLRKMKAFGDPPLGRETEESQARRLRILKKEGIINRNIALLQFLNAKKQEMDKRELNKFKNNPKGGDYVGEGENFVKLEKNKVVPKKETGRVMFHMRTRREVSPKMNSRKEAELIRKERAETAKKEKLRRMSIMEVYKEQVQEGIHSEATQAAVEEAMEDFFS